jgi:hypothetical protein
MKLSKGGILVPDDHDETPTRMFDIEFFAYETIGCAVMDRRLLDRTFDFDLGPVESRSPEALKEGGF